MVVVQRSKRSWPVALLNGGVGLVLLLIVAVLALVVNPPAPPGIAAFAPQANKPITQAPLSQSAAFGEGDGQCAEGQDCAARATTTTTTPEATTTTLRPVAGKVPPRGVPSSLQCYTWPDGTVTQTFDPQSPPCIATWDDSQGNGGATSKGVTESEIRVAMPVWETAPGWPTVKPIVDFFNTRFQFYGRKITIVPFISQQANAQATGEFHIPETQRADAAQITQLDVFATTDFVDPVHYSWSLPVFRDALTRNKIVSIHGGETPPYGTVADIVASQPYEWTYYTPAEPVLRNTARLTCRQLVGKTARHAQDTALHSVTRKFAVMAPVDASLGGPLPGLDTMLQVLSGCDVKPRVVRYDYADRAMQASMSATMNELRNDGVTSIIWFPYAGGGTPRHPWFVADSIGYRPEWVVIGWHQYQTAFELNNPQSQTAGAFGVGIWNKMPALEQEMWHRAYLAAGGDPAVVNGGGLPGGRPFYQELLLLASGIQMAGPDLTPETFAEGLQSTKFPNPGAGAPPYYQAKVGFGPDDVTMVEDYNGFWLDIRLAGPEVSRQKNLNTSRGFCYVDLGSRWTFDTWPTTDRFYESGVCL